MADAIEIKSDIATSLDTNSIGFQCMKFKRDDVNLQICEYLVWNRPDPGKQTNKSRIASIY